VEISLRDEKGQGVVEYILVLVVAVSIILGGIYQLNDAFKKWAENYFGNYLACLLETGELPSLSGTGGDSGVCNQFFKPYTFSEGRPLLAGAGGAGGDDGAEGKTNGARESKRSGNSGAAGNYTQIGSFGSANSSSQAGGGGSGGRTGKMSSTYTGSTDFSRYGSGGYSSGPRVTPIQLKTSLDQRFVFDDSREDQKRRPISSPTKLGGSSAPKFGTPINLSSGVKKAHDMGDDDNSGFSFGGLIKYLILAGILLALIVFLGGQALSIRKSME
jgi:hypothetical protein